MSAVYSEINMDPSLYSKVEKGKRGVTVDTLKQICMFLKVSADDVIFDMDEKSIIKTSPEPEGTRDGETVEEKEDVISLLREIKDQQKRLAISYETISHRLSLEYDAPSGKAPIPLNEQKDAVEQQMVDHSQYEVKQSDLSREELKAIAYGKTASKKKEAAGKSGALPDQGKVGKLHEAEDSEETAKPPKKGGASRKSN